MNNHNKCLDCEKPFSRWYRIDKKFCDGTCRKRFARKKKAAEKQCKKIKSELYTLSLTLKRNPHARTTIAIGEMKYIRDQLDLMLRLYEE